MPDKQHLHSNELTLDVPLVESLIADQFPKLRHLPVKDFPAPGSTNRLFTLGDELLVRLPRQPGGGISIEKEARWLPLVSRDLPVDVPDIVEVGLPGPQFAESWCLVRRLPGRHPGTPDRQIDPKALADVMLALQDTLIPPDAQEDHSLRHYRGQPLSAFNQQVQSYLDSCRQIEGIKLDLDSAERLWRRALELPTPERPVSWFHGDLVAENLLVSDGRLSGVLDFGGLSIGNPTVELHGAWELFDPPSRDQFRQAMAIDNNVWEQARAWALGIALGAISYYWQTLPNRVQDRLVMARSAIADGSTSDL